MRNSEDIEVKVAFQRGYQSFQMYVDKYTKKLLRNPDGTPATTVPESQKYRYKAICNLYDCPYRQDSHLAKEWLRGQNAAYFDNLARNLKNPEEEAEATDAQEAA